MQCVRSPSRDITVIFRSLPRSAFVRFELSTRYIFRPCFLPLTSIGKAARTRIYHHVCMYIYIYVCTHLFILIPRNCIDCVSYNFLFRPYWLFAAMSEIHLLVCNSFTSLIVVNIEKSNMSDKPLQLICQITITFSRISICRILCQTFAIINSRDELTVWKFQKSLPLASREFALYGVALSTQLQEQRIVCRCITLLLMRVEFVNVYKDTFLYTSLTRDLLKIPSSVSHSIPALEGQSYIAGRGGEMRLRFSGFITSVLMDVYVQCLHGEYRKHNGILTALRDYYI